MQRRNIIGVETRRGYRTVELYEGDLTALGCSVDVLVTSAFAGDYIASPGTVLGALKQRLGLEPSKLAATAEYDFRESLGVWVSGPVANCEFSRVLCVDLLGGSLDVDEALQNVFVCLLVLEAKGISVRSAALPVLGAGQQRLEVESVIRTLLAAVTDYFNRSSQIERVVFVEINPSRINQLDAAMNTVLGRSKVTLPKSQLLQSLRADIRQALLHADSLFLDGGHDLRSDWLRVLQQEEPQSFEIGVLSRKLVERVVGQLPIEYKAGANLQTKIENLGTIGVATWMRGYMHVLRHLGNESAHETQPHERKPRHLAESDLALCLLCVQRLLEFWNAHEDTWRNPGAV